MPGARLSRSQAQRPARRRGKRRLQNANPRGGLGLPAVFYCPVCAAAGRSLEVWARPTNLVLLGIPLDRGKSKNLFARRAGRYCYVALRHVLSADERERTRP